jgi:predicted nucleotidyltransferase
MTTTVTWTPSLERRARLEAELERIRRELPRLGVLKAILFGSLVPGDVGRASDLDLILVAPSDERFGRRLARFYEALEPAVALDLLVYTPGEFATMAATSPFVRAALAGGRVIYET